MAIYQSFDIDRSNSSWVFIQPSEGARIRLKELCSAAEASPLTCTECMIFHLHLASELAANWRCYINFLEARLDELDEKALRSKVGVIKKSDYSINFKDAQILERLRRKLIKASLILKLSIDISESLSVEFRKFIDAITLKEDPEVFHALRRHSATLNRHLRVVDFLLAKLAGTSRLIFHILEYRRDEKSIETSLSIKDNGDQIKRLTEHTLVQSSLITQFTREMHEDSKFVKIVTFLALLYTPASLIATVFSSNLIQIQKADDSRGTMSMVLVTDFWKYPLLTAGLVAVTLFLAFGWKIRWAAVRRSVLRYL